MSETHTNNVCINIISVDNVNEADNLARGKPASQSSTYQTYDADRAVDGNRDGDFNRGSCTHTDVGDDHPLWVVDMQQMMIVKEVTLYTRQDNTGMFIN